MGTMVEARCECGYSSGTMTLGGGRNDHLRRCGFPCFCKACKNIFNGNLFASKVFCSQCDTSSYVTYDDPSLVLAREPTDCLDQEIFSWNTRERIGRDVTLNSDKYFCPSCELFELRFVVVALYS